MASRPLRVYKCNDCDTILMTRSAGLFGGDWNGDWFMTRDAIWRTATRGTSIRFLCVQCLEQHLGRKLVASDFRRSARVNFVGQKSARLRHRMRGLQPAKRLRSTIFAADDRQVQPSGGMKEASARTKLHQNSQLTHHRRVAGRRATAGTHCKNPETLTAAR